MAVKSRREFVQRTVLLAGATLAAPKWVHSVLSAAQGESLPAYESRSSARPPHVPIRVLDTEKMPAPAPAGALGWGRKVLFQNKHTGDQLTILYVPPGSPGAAVHYHTFHEWAYNIEGDFTNNESTSPEQHYGPLQRFREGNFLDRPPYSLHGGERGRQEFMASQVGAIIMIMEEGDVAGGTFTVEPGQTGMKFNPDYKKIKTWAVPRIIDTIDRMPWEPHPSVSGLKVKHLVDDQGRGFRATMWFLPSKWESGQSREFVRPYYYKQAHQFNFVIAGDVKIQAYRAPGEKAESYELGKYFFVERPPMGIWGLADGVVSQAGGVWLEVTYAKGTSIPNVPIEDAIYV